MKLKLGNVQRLRTGQKNVVSFEIPKQYEAAYAELIHSWPDRLNVEIASPVRHRSTGEHSQNHRINGFIQQICIAKGMEFDTLKYYCKYKAIDRGYPFDTVGEFVVPWSESRISTVEAMYLIDTIEQIAAEQGIVLQED